MKNVIRNQKRLNFNINNYLFFFPFFQMNTLEGNEMSEQPMVLRDLPLAIKYNLTKQQSVKTDLRQCYITPTNGTTFRPNDKIFINISSANFIDPQSIYLGGLLV